MTHCRTILKYWQRAEGAHIKNVVAGTFDILHLRKLLSDEDGQRRKHLTQTVERLFIYNSPASKLVGARFDLSCPLINSVNDGMPQEYGSLQ